MPHLAHPEGHRDRYLCVLFAGGGVWRIGGTASILCLVYIAVEYYFAIIRPRRLKLFCRS